MAAGSMEKPEQFVAVDERTFRIDFPRRDKLTMPDLGVTIPFVIDSELARVSSGGDPWAKDYLKNNIAGGGAFKLEAWHPGTETIYVRNDDWKYHGNNAIFNIASCQNKAMDKLIDGARFTADRAEYDTDVRGFLQIGMDEVPMVPICQPQLSRR